MKMKVFLEGMLDRDETKFKIFDCISNKNINKKYDADLVLEGLDLNFDETEYKDLSEDFDLDIEDETPEEKVEQLFDGYLGEKNFDPNPLEYGPNAMYRRNGTVYRKSVDNLWEAYLRDGSPGRQGQSAPGGGCGVVEVKNIIENRIAMDNIIEFPLLHSEGNILTPEFMTKSFPGYDNNGTIIPNAGYNATYWIPVTPGDRLIFLANGSDVPAIHGNYYDSNYAVIVGEVNANGQSIIPTNAAFARINYNVTNPVTSYIISKTKTRIDIKVDFAGDSITEGVGATNVLNNYPNNFAKNVTQIVDINNIAISDSTLVNLSGHNPFSVRVLTGVVRKDCDMLMYLLGTNDYRYGVTLGSLGDATNSTFYGSLKIVLDYMATYRQMTKVVLIKCINTTDVVSPVSALSLFWKAIDDTAALYPQVKVLDMNDSGIITNGLQVAPYQSSNEVGNTILHPSDLGYALMGQYAAKQLFK